MNNWSDTARNELERFLVAERGWLAQDPEHADVDHEEVIADLRAHVREELAVAGVLYVGVEELHRVLRGLRPGFGTEGETRPRPEQGSASPSSKRRPEPPGEHSKGRSFHNGLVLLFGIVLPIAALGLELASHSLRSFTGLDPIPGLINVLLIALVPIMNGVLLWRTEKLPSRAVMFGAGMALGTTILYGLVFLPAIPLGLVGLVFFGLGILVLTPPIACILTWVQVTRARRLGAPPGALAGSAVAILLLTAGSIFGSLTNLGASWALDDDPAVRARGLSLLRSVGSEEQLLAYCYGSARLSGDGEFAFAVLDAGLVDPPSESEARELYFLVTGQAFNSVDPPDTILTELGARGWDADGWRRRNSDRRAQGGTEVAGRIEGLDLVESRIDAQLETEAALFYLEWELEFGNDSDVPQEARAQVQLPPGGYVSRLTLWVNGEEREAAFDETGKVRQAYQEVAIVRRRDPVLVTHSGTDQVMVQCFPVPAGGKLRTRIGITAPLLLTPYAESPGDPEGSLTLPRFAERNFGLAPALEHQVWLQGRGEYLVLPEGLSAAAPGDGQRLARGSLPASALDGSGNDVRTTLAGLTAYTWTSASLAPTADGEPERVVLQRLEVSETQPIDRLMLVLDGGAGLEQAGEALAYALEYVPAEVELGLIVAGGSPTELEVPGAASPSRLKALERALEAHDFTGGVNAAPSLVEAFDQAQAEPGGAVIWLHGVQPISFSGSSALEQRLERSKDSTRIHALAAVPGANRLVAELGDHPALVLEARTGALTDDLVQLLRALTIGSKGLVPVRGLVNLADLEHLPEGAQPVSNQLARLWAGDEATRLQAIPKSAERKAGVDLALAHHLVTPRTGAVVLETQAQFDRHGLKPVTIDEVPSVPEPEMIALLLLVAALLGFAVLRGRAAG